jgi:hypothetical protein
VGSVPLRTRPALPFFPNHLPGSGTFDATDAWGLDYTLIGRACCCCRAGAALLLFAGGQLAELINGALRAALLVRVSYDAFVAFEVKWAHHHYLLLPAGGQRAASRKRPMECKTVLALVLCRCWGGGSGCRCFCCCCGEGGADATLGGAVGSRHSGLPSSRFCQRARTIFARHGRGTCQPPLAEWTSNLNSPKGNRRTFRAGGRPPWFYAGRHQPENNAAARAWHP